MRGPGSVFSSLPRLLVTVSPHCVPPILGPVDATDVSAQNIHAARASHPRRSVTPPPPDPRPLSRLPRFFLRRRRLGRSPVGEFHTGMDGLGSHVPLPGGRAPGQSIGGVRGVCSVWVPLPVPQVMTPCAGAALPPSVFGGTSSTSWLPGCVRSRPPCPPRPMGPPACHGTRCPLWLPAGAGHPAPRGPARAACQSAPPSVPSGRGPPGTGHGSGG